MTSKAKRQEEMPIKLDPERFWTFEEARYYLRVGNTTLRPWIKDGRVQAYRLGGDKGRLLFFKKADLDKLFVLVEPSEFDHNEIEAEDEIKQV